MKVVALDAMGGDNAPRTEVEGAIAAARTGDVRVILVGDERAIADELARRGGRDLPVTIRHASQVISMHDSPSLAVRRKTDSSMRVAVGLVKSGEAQAVISAGNSGAMMACGLFVLKRLAGVDRPAILTTFPTRRGDWAALLDMGANVDCKPLNLVQFAVMGAAFARRAHGKSQPRVGVLSNGSEEHKGTDLTRETNALLRSTVAGFEYVGYVEGRDVFSGDVDVVVCDGFSGNLVLKVTEGAAETLAHFLRESIQSSLVSRALALAMIPTFRRYRQRMDYAEQGGAPLLGVRGMAFICHGGSSAKAIKNAILRASRLVDSRLEEAVQQAIAEHGYLSELAKGHGDAAASVKESTGR